MSAFTVDFKPSVEKKFNGPSDAMLKKVMDKVELLQSNPVPMGSIKLSTSEKLYRLRVGDYRIVYDVNVLSKQVMIPYVRHRKDVYRLMK